MKTFLKMNLPALINITTIIDNTRCTQHIQGTYLSLFYMDVLTHLTLQQLYGVDNPIILMVQLQQLQQRSQENCIDCTARKHKSTD